MKVSPTPQIIDIKQENRRDFMFRSLIAVPAGLIVPAISFPIAANADVTSKVASKAALRTVKRALRELEDMELLAVENDYKGMQAAIRVPPFTEIRRNCSILVKGSEDNEADYEALQAAYKSFITQIEALDSAAGLGSRGRKGIELSDSYKNSVATLNKFYALAEQTSATPMQDAE